ncbi:hypothetical protein BH09SUM1_BH09SUM1_17380 [soil metagenome]
MTEVESPTLEQPIAKTEKAVKPFPEDGYWRPSNIVAGAMVTAAMQTFFLLRASGTENIPRTGPLIIAPNHASYLDPTVVAAVVHPYRHIYWLAWQALFKQPVFAALIRSLGAVPVDTAARSDRGAYSASLRVLNAGKAICIFPEGERGWDGKLLPLQQGVVRLSMATGAAILPFAIHGALEAWPRWKATPQPLSPITARIMPPIYPPAAHTPADRRAAAPKIMRELELSLSAGMESLKAARGRGGSTLPQGPASPEPVKR